MTNFWPEINFLKFDLVILVVNLYRHNPVWTIGQPIRQRWWLWDLIWDNFLTWCWIYSSFSEIWFLARKWSFWWSTCISATPDGLLANSYDQDDALGTLFGTTSSRAVWSTAHFLKFDFWPENGHFGGQPVSAPPQMDFWPTHMTKTMP